MPSGAQHLAGLFESPDPSLRWDDESLGGYERET